MRFQKEALGIVPFGVDLSHDNVVYEKKEFSRQAKNKILSMRVGDMIAKVIIVTGFLLAVGIPAGTGVYAIAETDVTFATIQYMANQDVPSVQ